MADQHTFQILTKRPERMRDYCNRLEARAVEIAQRAAYMWGGVDPDQLSDWVQDHIASGPLPNVWLGVSIEDQVTADERIPLLMETSAAVRWVSAEPLLGAVDIGRWLEPTGVTCMDVCPDDRFVDTEAHEKVEVNGYMEPICRNCGLVATWTGYDEGLDWVVVGGESGPHARPMHPEWARSLRDQCSEAGVPFLFKQWGEWLPAEAMEVDDEETLRVQRQIIHGNHANLYVFDDHQQMGRVGKKTAGRLLDARLHDGYPEVRQ